MDKIWLGDPSLEQLNQLQKNHITDLIGIKFTEIGDNYLKACMPVNERTHQPHGILHGGASVVLAETLGSTASNLVVDSSKWLGVGLEVNANHIRPVAAGFVRGIATPIHIGSKTHVWDIKLYNDAEKINCISRLTVAIIPRERIPTWI